MNVNNPADVAAHSALDTGVHGAGADVLAVQGDITRELFESVHAGTDMVDNGAFIDAAGPEWGCAAMLIPRDFTALTICQIIVIPSVNDTDMHVTISVNYGQYVGGEAFNVHTGQLANQDIGAVVLNQNLAFDIAALVGDLAAGDLLTVRLSYSNVARATWLAYRGIRLRYS